MALGSVATTKRNASQGVEAGWYLLLSKVDSPPSGTQVAEVLFFREEADALAASTLVRATQTTAAERATLAAALEKAVGVEDRAPKSLRLIQQLTPRWRSLCESEEEEEQGEPDQYAHMIGKTVSLSLPMYNEEQTHIIDFYDGVVTVTEHAGEGIYKVTFVHEETPRVVEVAGSILAQAMAKESGKPDAIICMPESVKDYRSMQLMNALPISRKMTSQLHVDAAELMEVFQAAGLLSRSARPTSEGVRDMALTLIGNLEAMVQIDGSDKLTYPDNNAERLGEQIKRHHSAHAALVASSGSSARPTGTQPAAQHPRVAMLRALAIDDGAWNKFLEDSVAITCDSERRGALLVGSEYMRKGALEAYLRQSGEQASPAAIAALNTGGSVGSSSGANWSSDQLMEYIMLTIQPHLKSVQHTGDGSNQTRVVVQTTDLSGTDEERHMRLQLQHSFSSIERNSSEITTIKQLVALTGEEHSSALRVAVNSTGDDLKRLCTSEMDVEKALQGNSLPFPSSHRRARQSAPEPLARAARRPPP